jgi:hypothetical protein
MKNRTTGRGDDRCRGRGRLGDGRRQPGAARATVEVALGDAWRRADVGMVAAPGAMVAVAPSIARRRADMGTVAPGAASSRGDGVNDGGAAGKFSCLTVLWQTPAF